MRQSRVDALLQAGAFEFHTHVRWDQVSKNAVSKRNALQQDLEASRMFFEQKLGGDIATVLATGLFRSRLS